MSTPRAAATVLIGMGLLVAGAVATGGWRVLLWVLAAAIDYAGPACLTRERLRGLQRVAVEHFAERYSLFVIICLGESIVAIGFGAGGRALDAELVATVTLALLITIALWWTYFESAGRAGRGAAGSPPPPGGGGRRRLQLPAPGPGGRDHRLRGRRPQRGR
ncbi:MAG: low temperature requirement protein A [Chloroflexota bacterium]